MTWLDPSDPPMLIVHGDSDHTVPVRSSRYLYQALQDAGVKSTYIEIAGADHGFFNVHLPQPVAAFFESNL
jgi:dipeptidyl aminopeptidase/acylaminoacyl peptidase